MPTANCKQCWVMWFSMTAVLSDVFLWLYHFQLFATLWTTTCQAPLSLGFSRQEYWSGEPFPSPEDLPDPGIKTMSLSSPALAGGFLTTSATWAM